MRRAYVAWVLCVLWGGATAQDTDTGSGSAALTPRIVVNLPSTIELRLAATEITFDLHGDGLRTSSLACVHGDGGGDRADDGGSEIGEQVPVFPLGTGFRHGRHPEVTVVGRELASSYPPPPDGTDGRTPAGGDQDFVCYRTFLLRRFSNAADWHLTVERPAGSGTGSLHAVYVRDGGCAGSDRLQGLFPLYDGERRLLASAATSAPCPEGDVVVLAVRTNDVRAGEARAHLVYTLMAPAIDPIHQESPDE